MKPKVETNEKYSDFTFLFVISPINGEFCCCSFFCSDLSTDQHSTDSQHHPCTAEILHGMMFAVSESTSLCTDTTVVT